MTFSTSIKSLFKGAKSLLSRPFLACYRRSTGEQEKEIDSPSVLEIEEDQALVLFAPPVPDAAHAQPFLFTSQIIHGEVVQEAAIGEDGSDSVETGRREDESEELFRLFIESNRKLQEEVRRREAALGMAVEGAVSIANSVHRLLGEEWYSAIMEDSGCAQYVRYV